MGADPNRTVPPVMPDPANVITAAKTRLRAVLDRLRDRLRAWPWLALALAACGVMAVIAPWQLGVLVWALAKLALAAWLGYWIDRTVYPYARPHEAHDNQAFGAATLRRAIILVGAMIALALTGCSAQAAGVPAAAERHRALLTREAQRQFGLDAPVARLAAQVHQESAWRADARSPVGAQGLAQFMPGTSAWIAEIYPAELGAGPAPYSPAWSLRALAVYDRHLLARVQGHTPCDRWWFALRSYNGGLGHIRAESRHATDPLDRHAVDAACGTARRSVKHCPENTGYPRRILLRWEPLYRAAHWPGRAVCA